MTTKIEELRSQRKTVLDKAQQILASASDEQPLTDEQTAEAEGLIADAESIAAEIEAEQKRAVKAQELSAKINAARSLPDEPMLRKIANMGSLATSIHVGQDTAKAYSLPRNVRRVPVKNFAAQDDGMDPVVRAYRFGMWAMAQISATRSIAYSNPAAVNYCMDNGLWNAAHGEGGSDTTGSGVLVPDEFGTDLILLRERYGVARQLFNVIPMSSDTRTEPRQLTNLTAYFVGENSAGTESNLTFDNVTLVAKKLMVLARMSNELNADNVIGLADKLIGEIAWAFANKEDECAFNGLGTSTYGGITGARTRIDELTAGTAPGLVLGAGNAWSELTLANFHSVVGALPTFADRPGAAWVCHKTFANAVMQKLATAAGGAVSGDIINGVRRDFFLGYPVYYSQVFPSTEANSQIPVLFGDFSLGAMFGARGMEQIAFSTEATVGGESMWERDQIGVRGTERFDVVVHDYGTNSVAGPIVGLETASG